jgi:hypothetical protein
MYEYIGILLGSRPILHISRVKVNDIAKFSCGLLWGKSITYMVRNDLLEGNKVKCTLFAVNIVTEDVCVFACVSVSLSVAVITNQETEAGV